MKHTVYLGLGSNVGHRVEFIAAAIRGITDFEKTVVDAVSNVYETEPVGNIPQSEFLNCALSVRTDLSVEQFHAKMKWLEKEIGRTDSERWGPREIDIDLLFFDSVVLNTDAIRLPHAELVNRKFVLQPLSDIAPKMVHPVVQINIEELNNETSDRHGVAYSEMHTSQLLALINDSITNPTV
ncbi:MAG: 2-amino-4-hydroxy-6-hydroxymethyldihydropteridine diphosphokinase [Bacteriovoracaceae bacterium]|nr:2-amino-4-hydroxy-6-hydroxymethyldihydropteridine diphosphokinase [Bacteroidota bacterium]